MPSGWGDCCDYKCGSGDCAYCSENTIPELRWENLMEIKII